MSLRYVVNFADGEVQAYCVRPDDQLALAEPARRIDGWQFAGDDLPDWSHKDWLEVQQRLDRGDEHEMSAAYSVPEETPDV